jgi:hypothetical protein
MVSSQPTTWTPSARPGTPREPPITNAPARLQHAADANGDGCVDVVDIQALLAAQGQARRVALHVVA